MSNSICRLCLKKDPFLIDIFSKDYEKMFEISIVIATHFAIQVEEVGSFSKHICSDCWNKIKEFHLFYCYVNSQQLTLRERDIEFITLKPELDILENKIKNEGDNTPTENVAENNQPPSETLPLSENIANFSDSDDHDFEPFQPTICSIDDEEDDLPLSKLVKTKSPEKIISESKLPKKRKLKKKYAKSKNVKEKKQSTKAEMLKPENHELIKLYVDLNCDLCSTIFGDTTMVEAIQHYKSVHDTRGYLMCCGKKIFQFVHLMDHINTHVHPNKGIPCDKCTKTCITRRALKRHMLQDHPPIERLIHKCDDCPESFALKEFLVKHQQRHMKSKEKKYICDICNKGYQSASILRSHKKTHQNMEVICEICARILKNRYTLKTHMKEHQGNPAREQCDICQKWLSSKFSVNYHKKRVHTAPTGKFECHVCGKNSPNQSALKTHITFRHGERIHKCTICVKSFQKLCDLQEHIAVHTGIDLYTCTFCPMSFKFKANFYAHRKKMHPTELAQMQKSVEENYAKEKQQLKGTTSS